MTDVPVRKQNVEQFDIGEGALVLTKDEALLLHTRLGEALGRPTVDHKGCGDRYSHGPHWHGNDIHFFYCSGRAFDAT